MNDKDFRNFLQKQQDLEDEYETNLATLCLARLQDILKSHGMTLDQWKSKLMAKGKAADLTTIKLWERKSSK